MTSSVLMATPWSHPQRRVYGNDPSFGARFAPFVLLAIAIIMAGSSGHLLTHGDTPLAVPADVTLDTTDATGDSADVDTPVTSDAHDNASTAETDTVTPAPSVPSALTQKPETITRVLEVGEAQSLKQLLMTADVSDDEADAATKAARKFYNRKTLPAGMEVVIKSTRIGDDQTLDEVSFQADRMTDLKIARVADAKAAVQFKAEKVAIPVERHRMAARVVMKGSLAASARQQGVPSSVTASLLRIFAHTVDFQRDLKNGDVLDVYYDQPVTVKGDTVGDPTVIYAGLKAKSVQLAVYRVIFQDGTAEYFNERGESMKRSLLRTPVESAHVTSSFGMRRHPILGYSKMHKGVDFSAPVGTPIYASGSGVVKEIGWKGAYGRYIRLQHDAKIGTAYAHLSRFARNLKAGDRVGQGDVIGYVGTTGRSTGPHLHYEVLINNAQVNPMSINMTAGRRVTGRMMEDFRAGMDRIRRDYASLLKTADASDSQGAHASMQIADARETTPKRKER